MDLQDFPTRLYSNQSVQPLKFIKYQSHVYASISLPVRHYDFKIKFLRNNHSNVRRINFSVKRIAESNVENAQNNVLGHFGRNQNRIYIFSSQLVTANII